MEKRVVLTLIMLATLIGCNEYPTSDVFSLNRSVGEKDTSSLLITSNKAYPAEREREVSEGLSQAVNSGQYNITSIVTTHTDYLMSAEIRYQEGTGAGNKLRLSVFHGGSSSTHQLPFPQDDTCTRELRTKSGKIVAILSYSLK